MAAVNYAEQYSRELSQAFPYVLYFGRLYQTPNNQKYKVIDAKTIKIPTITTSGRVDGNRDTITGFTRNVDNEWETKTLTNHREWSTLLHPQDVNQTNMVLTIKNATQVMNEEQKFPEMDAYTVSKIHSDAVEQGVEDDTTVLTVDNFLKTFDTWMKEMDEKRVPKTGRILYLTPDMQTLLKQSKEISRSISIDKNGATTINRNISRIDEVEIQEVPSDLMKTVFDFTNGWKPGSSAKQINALLIHPIAVFTPVSYEFASIEEPSAHSKGKYLYYEESFEDVFIFNMKKHAIKFNVAA